MKSVLYRLICGVAIGVGGVLPGVSGGILAISLGVYEKMMLAIGDFFHSVKANFKYLLPIVLGGGIGILLTSNVLSILITRYEAPLLALFSGLVLGSVPGLYTEVRKSGPIKWKHLIAALLGLGFILLFALGENSVVASGKIAELTIPVSILAGAVLAFGVVIPGISSSFILIYMGLYSAVLGVISGVFDLSALAAGGISGAFTRFLEILVPLIFISLGFGVCALVVIKIVNRMMKRHHAASYAAIIGFVVGSVALILPKSFASFSWVSAVMLLAGFALSYLQSRHRDRISKKEAAVLAVEAARVKASAEAPQK
jgi:putative membrane protein